MDQHNFNQFLELDKLYDDFDFKQGMIERVPNDDIFKEKQQLSPLYQKNQNHSFKQEFQDQNQNKRLQFEQENQERQKTKGNVKNTYIKKIHSLINFQQPEENNRVKKEPENRELHSRIQSYDTLFSLGQGNDDQIKKLERNRESARNSRQRKKVYIELLENKVEQLTQQLQQQKNWVNDQNQNPYHSQTYSQQIQQMLQGKEQIFLKIEKALSEGQIDNMQISLLIDSFKLRFGASGKERVKSLDQLFDQLQKNFLPMSYKYLLLASDLEIQQQEIRHELKKSQSDVSYQKNDVLKNIISKLNLSQEQYQKVSKFLKKLAGEKQKYDQLLLNLNASKNQFTNLAQHLENLIEQLSLNLSPNQVAQFLLSLDKEKNTSQFSNVNLWFGNMDNDDDQSINQSSIYKDQNNDSEDFSVYKKVKLNNEQRTTFNN